MYWSSRKIQLHRKLHIVWLLIWQHHIHIFIQCNLILFFEKNWRFCYQFGPEGSSTVDYVGWTPGHFFSGCYLIIDELNLNKVEIKNKGFSSSVLTCNFATFQTILFHLSQIFKRTGFSEIDKIFRIFWLTLTTFGIKIFCHLNLVLHCTKVVGKKIEK